MATRARRGGGATWWVAAAVVLIALVLLWLFRARRVEAPAPPAIRSTDPSLAAPPDDHVHDEIAPEEKAALEHIIRERAVPSPDR